MKLVLLIFKLKMRYFYISESFLSLAIIVLAYINALPSFELVPDFLFEKLKLCQRFAFKHGRHIRVHRLVDALSPVTRMF